MTIAGIIGRDQAPTTHSGLRAWVRDVAALTNPDDVVWCDGSDEERERLTRKLIDAGTLIPQQTGPRSFRCALDPDDVAQVGYHTYVCTRDEAAVDPASNWMEPVDMKIILTEEYRACMSGRTMYVVPFYLETSTAGGRPTLGVQITDSAYVVVAMHLMSSDSDMGAATFGDGSEFVRCLHSVGAPRRAGQADVPWPCDHTKYIAQFPETRTIFSYGSGFPGNALLGDELDISGLQLNRSENGDTQAVTPDARQSGSATLESWFTRAGRG